jgi:hypothetical protein
VWHSNRKAASQMSEVKKSVAGGGAPSLDILAAKLRIIEAEFYSEPYEVAMDSGRSFTADPNVNVKVEVVKNLVESGKDEGVKFYDRFKLKQDEDGDWVFSKYSKLGNLMMVRYGKDWFEDETAGFDVNDLLDFEFIAQVEPKQDRNGKPLPGSSIDWKSMRPAGGADEAEAEDDTAGDVEEEFDDIPL